jgi:RimJ/RimL family protein N-acetyltransferase
MALQLHQIVEMQGGLAEPNGMSLDLEKSSGLESKVMFNTKFESRFVEVRHFKNVDYSAFLKFMKDNLDHMADYLGEGRFFKGFSDFEFSYLFKGYVANESPFEHFGGFYKDQCIAIAVLCPATSEYGVQFIYWVDKDHMGHGVATKMVNELTEHAFQLGFWNIECHTDATNLASQKVLEKNSFGLADKYSIEPRGLKDSGDMIAWIKFNPYGRNPLGPKRSALELLKPRIFQLNDGRF